MWGFMGIAHERANKKGCPLISFGVGNPVRSAAPQRGILSIWNHAVNQEGKEWEELDAMNLRALLKTSDYFCQFTENQPVAGNATH